MANFVVETFVAGGSADRFATDAHDILAAAEGRPGPRAVRLLRSYLVEADEMGFHIVEAATAAQVARVARRANVEVERIVRAVALEPPDREEAR